MVCSDNEENDDIQKINSVFFYFYANLFKEKLETNTENPSDFLKKLSTPSLSKCQKQLSDEELTKKERHL